MSIPHLETIPRYLAHWARHTPNATAIIHAGQAVSYAELARQVDEVARALLADGVRQGDRVAVLAHPTRFYWLTFLASLSIGAVWLGLNPKYRLPELEYNVGNCRPTLLLGLGGYEGDDFTGTLQNLAKTLQRHRAPVVFGPVKTPDAGLEAWDEFLIRGLAISDAQLQAARDSVNPDSAALIVYTSGSTGRPKGAVLGHRGLARSFEIQAGRAPVNPIRVIANLPINHIGGVGDLCCTPLIQGGTIVLQERFDAHAMLEAVDKHGVNAFMQVPTTLKILAEHPDFSAYDLSNLRYVSWGGGPLPLDIVRRWRALGVQLGTTYGMTEITGSITYSTPEASDDQLAGTVGRPIAEIELRVVGDDGRDVAPHETGEIWVKHPGLLLEYFENVEATKEAFSDDGFFKTGDVGYLRPDGNMCLVARTKEIFKSGGYNTYPREIELALEEMPAVRLAAVVPVPDPRFGEVGIAYVETSDPAVNEATLTDWCRKRLTNYKVPKRILVVDALPLLPVGKVDKMTLRKRAAAEIDSLGL